jgi:hypothetical protein
MSAWHIASFRGGAEFGRYRGTCYRRDQVANDGAREAIRRDRSSGKKPVACLSLQ